MNPIITEAKECVDPAVLVSPAKFREIIKGLLDIIERKTPLRPRSAPDDQLEYWDAHGDPP